MKTRTKIAALAAWWALSLGCTSTGTAAKPKGQEFVLPPEDDRRYSRPASYPKRKFRPSGEQNVPPMQLPGGVGGVGGIGGMGGAMGGIR